MSQIQNVITTTFRARGNQAIAQMGAVAQGFGTIGRVINDNSRLSERLNAQWRAIGTTIRYAVAGGAIFGLTAMVGQLRDVQTQLGLMQAIGSQQGGLALTNRQITDLGGNLRQTAVDTLTPVREVNDAVVNFLSTVQGVKPSDIPSIITNIGQAAKLAQTPVEELTKSVTTSNIAFQRANNPKNIAEFNRMWFALISTAPGGPSAAPEISKQIPQLASMMSLGQGKKVTGRDAQAQMLSLVLGALRTGATPSTGIRGLTYLLQSIIQPTGKAGHALAGIGISPRSIYEEGVYANLMRLLERVTGRMNKSTRTKIAGLDDEALANIDENNGTLPGITPTEMTRLRAMIPRIHGIRAAVILAGQLSAHGDVGSLADDLEMMRKAQNDELTDALNMRKAWQNYRKRARLQEASVAINAMALQVATIFEPVFNFVAGQATDLSKLAQRHQTATKGVAIGGASFLAALGIGRFLGAGRLPIVNRIPGLRGLLGGGLGQAFVTANAAQAAISGNQALGATPQNPMYVTVVGQLFGGGTRSPSTTPGGGGGGITGDATHVAEDVLAYKALRNVRRFGSLLKRGGRGVVGLGEEAITKGDIAFRNPAIARALALRAGLKAIPIAGVALDALINAPGAGTNEQAYEARLQRAKEVFTKQYGTIAHVQGMPVVKPLKGQAEIYLTIDTVGAGGKVTRRRVHVPMSMWEGGRTPSTKGNSGSRRAG